MIYSIEHPECSISELVSSHRMANMEKNRAVLKSISGAIPFVGGSVLHPEGMPKASKPLVILAITLHFSSHLLFMMTPSKVT